VAPIQVAHPVLIILNTQNRTTVTIPSVSQKNREQVVQSNRALESLASKRARLDVSTFIMILQYEFHCKQEERVHLDGYMQVPTHLYDARRFKNRQAKCQRRSSYRLCHDVCVNMIKTCKA
jgi:hypothetical protein